jgi:AraC family transcriptional activator of pobA
MAKTENRLDISNSMHRAAQRMRSETPIAVPRYSLYGDAVAAREWFVNVEPLDQRASPMNWNIPPHTHPKFTQMVFVADGSGRMTLDGDAIPFTGPCALVVPPFRIHSFHYAEASSGTVVTIENNYLGDLLARAPELRSVLEIAGAFPLAEQAQGQIARNIDMLASELRSGKTGSAIGAEIQLLQIVLTMLRDRPAEEVATPTPRSELVDRFIELVETRYREQPEIDGLAGELGVTPAQLRNACKATTGLAPLAILHDRVAAEAKRCLIYTPMSVAEIGYSLGFDDAAYFTRFFRRTTGKPPTSFRKNNVSA